MDRFIATYKKIAVIFLNTLLVFILINFIAYLVPGPLSKVRNVESIIPNHQMLKNNPLLMQEVYDGKSPELIKQLIAEAPNVKSHPVLQFMLPEKNTRFYHIGFEGCRYNSYINDGNVHEVINGGSWLLGGSTAFGFGVPDDETMGYFLNQLDSGKRWINFSTPNYHQQLEIQKLILLLKKGYRPKRVVFLDGLNDLFQLTSNHFEPAETPGRPFHAYSHEFNIENIRLNRNLLYALPAVRLFYEYQAEYLVKTGKANLNPSQNVYSAQSLYNTQPYLAYLVTEITSLPVNEALLKKVETYYRQNIAMLDTLSKAYGFEYAVFFQPIGLFYDKNIFCTSHLELANQLRNYTAMEAMYSHIRQLLAQHNFQRFYDCSQLDASCPTPYVDLTHYSQPLNQRLAKYIISTLSL